MESQENRIERLSFDDVTLAGELFGPHNRNLSHISQISGVAIDSRGTTLTLTADSRQLLDAVSGLINQLYEMVRSGMSFSLGDIDQGWRMVSADAGAKLSSLFKGSEVAVSSRRKIRPKTPTQRDYIEAIASHDLVFGIGPAGTGKTYLAVAMAVAALSDRSIKRLVLTRPAVEAGERLGFLPGDMLEKVNPYLRPLYDALHDMLDFGKVQEMIESGRIEVAPLAFMRGRTLNDAFIILDEAQNTTPEQMKMFLTRLGFNSKAVVTGDVTQIDLPGATRSGLIHAREVLRGVEGIGMVNFHQGDVIRHELVGRIVEAYERHTQKEQEPEKDRQAGRS